MFEIDLAALIRDYGYLAILLGTFLEGETIVIIAGVLAQQGLLSAPLVALCAFVGSCSSDQLMFWLGQTKGVKVLNRFPRLHAQTVKATNLLRRYETALILGFRFVYGVRNVTPILMGVSGVSRPKFIVLNVIGAIVWAASFTAGGYFFGGVFSKIKDSIPHAELWLAGIAIAIILFILWRRRQKWGRKAAKEKTAIDVLHDADADNGSAMIDAEELAEAIHHDAHEQEIVVSLTEVSDSSGSGDATSELVTPVLPKDTPEGKE